MVALVILCISNGTLIYPFIMYTSGTLLTIFLLSTAGYISWFAGALIIKSAHATGGKRYEDIALKTYGRKCATFTSIMMLITMLGFVTAMIVLVSQFESDKNLVQNSVPMCVGCIDLERPSSNNCQHSNRTDLLGFNFQLHNPAATFTSKDSQRAEGSNND